MFESHQKNTGTGYTGTVALLAIAVFFIPGALLMSRSFGILPLTVAVSSIVLCLALARTVWKRSSQLTIPSIESLGGRK